MNRILSKQFKKDIKKKSDSDLKLLEEFVKLVENNVNLSFNSCKEEYKKYNVHPVKHGEHKGRSNSHIKPNLLLIYEVKGNDLYFYRFGRHNEIGLTEGLEEARQETALISNGIYSVLNDDWLKEPIKTNIPELDKEGFDKLFTEWEDKYFDLVSQFEAPLDESFIPLVEEFALPRDIELNNLAERLEGMGYKVRQTYRSEDFDKRIHYQIISKTGNKTEEDLAEEFDKVDAVLEEFEDRTGCSCTINMGLQEDGFISAGFDIRGRYYKPGDDTVVYKPTKIRFRNGKPASQKDIDELSDISDKMGMDVTNMLPVDKPNKK